MVDLDQTRRARAYLAWLFEPTDPGLQSLVALHGPAASACGRHCRVGKPQRSSVLSQPLIW